MRKLATIRKIDAIEPIEGADAIEVATVGGWKVVVKKNEYSIGSKVIYCEIDSWIPTTIAPFLTKAGHFPKTYGGVEGEKLRTIKLRGQISQGLILSTKTIRYSDGQEIDLCDSDEEADVTEILGIQKWEPPVSAQLAGLAKGNFPSLVPKTDQERVQNCAKQLAKWAREGLTWEETEKLEGSSMTCYLPEEGDFEVCSRNLSLKQDENNSFWKVALANAIEINMRNLDLHGLAIQGELIGEGIQGNIYGLKGQEFYVYDIYDTRAGSYICGEARTDIINALGLKHVPILASHTIIEEMSMQELINWADGKSKLNPNVNREGIVFKCNEDPTQSFKAISNLYLAKQKD
jgi:RNA ligase (TIGR02306 family)